MIVLVRHGETAGNAGRVVQTDDTPLNERGMQQARHLARRLSEHDIGFVLCSDLTRAQMTAAPILEQCGAPSEYTPLLRERSFGELRGTPYSQLTHDIFAPGYVPPGGESEAAFHERADRAWLRVAELSASVRGDLLVVTHGLMCGALARRCLQFESNQVIPMRWGNTSVTLCDARAPHRVSLLNCIAHLPDASADKESAAV